VHSGVQRRPGLDKRFIVQARTLSGIIRDRHVDLLKLDVEGAELDVFRDLESDGTLSSMDPSSARFTSIR
jgi:FkbM family methyltransferase